MEAEDKWLQWCHMASQWESQDSGMPCYTIKEGTISTAFIQSCAAQQLSTRMFLSWCTVVLFFTLSYTHSINKGGGQNQRDANFEKIDYALHLSENYSWISKINCWIKIIHIYISIYLLSTYNVSDIVHMFGKHIRARSSLSPSSLQSSGRDPRFLDIKHQLYLPPTPQIFWELRQALFSGIQVNV